MSFSSQSLRRVDSKKWLSFFSPAKINLFFRVLHKREDGFHEIASLFQAISLYDTIKVRVSEKDLFTCTDPSLAMDEKNLVCKALHAFRENTKEHSPVEIHLDKKIPMQAGLGGGSSNAATILWALTQLFSVNISREELIEMGSFLGSDVPFFFSSGTAYVTGRGEILEDLSIPTALENDSFIWIAKPEMGLSTPLVYGACKPSLLPNKDPKKTLSTFFSGTAPDFYNDLEEAAFSVCPLLIEIKKGLFDLGFKQVILCCSGTAFFCIGPVSNPVLRGLKFFQTHLISKEKLRWYAL